MAGELLSDADVGIDPAPAPSAPAPGMPSPSPSILTVRPGAAPATIATPIGGSAPTLPSSVTPNVDAQPAQARSAPPQAPAASPNDASSLLSDADVGLAPHPDAPKENGALSNSADDGYASGAAKGAATGVIKGVGDAVGAVGGLGNLADYLIARVDAKLTGRTPEAVMAANAAKRAATEADMNKTALGRLASASDPTKILPAPDDVSGPVLAKTGEYVPTTMPGRMAQAAVEGAVGGFGPGGGAISPGTAGTAVAGALAKQAPAMAVASGLGQGASEVTGDPLAGLATGLVVPAAVEHGAAAVGKVAKPIVAGIPGIESVPGVGPAVTRGIQAGAGSDVAGLFSTPQAARDFAAAPAADPIIPNSPQTLAATVGNDPKLLQAEKDARNASVAEFNTLDAQKSAAQKAALTGAQPDGDVFAPGQALRSRLDAIDSHADQIEDTLTAAHQDAVTNRASATQAFADSQAQGLAARQAGRAADQQADAVTATGDLGGRVADRADAAAADKAQADTARQSSLDALRQSYADAHASLLGQAQDAASAVGPRVSPEDTGALLRSAMDEASTARTDAKRKLYDAVDPDGTLTGVLQPVQQAVQGIRQSIDPHAGVQPTGAEAALWNDIQRAPPVVPFASLQKFDSRVTAAMSDARRNPNPSDPEAINRLTTLKSAVMDSINNSAENHIAWEQKQVAAGQMSPDDTASQRLSFTDEYGFPGDAIAAERSAAAAGNPAGDVSARGSSPVAGARGADPTAAGGLGPAAGGQGEAAGAGQGGGAVKAPREESLFQHIARSGGLAQHGDVAQILDGNRFIPGYGMLVRKAGRGMALDEALRSATDAGYLHDPGAAQGAGVRTLGLNDLLDLISREAGGDKVYRLGADVAPQPYEGLDHYAAAHAALGEHYAEHGIDLAKVSPEVQSTARDMIASGEAADPDIAFERAVMQHRENFETEHEGRVAQTGELHGWDIFDDAGGSSAGGGEVAPGGDDGARSQQGAGAASEGGGERDRREDDREAGPRRNAQAAGPLFDGEITPNFDAAAAGRLRAAKDAHIEQKTIEGNPYVKGTMATNGFAGQHLAPDSAVIAKTWRPDDKGGAAAVDAFMRYVSGKPQAAHAIADYALNGLRDKIGPLGTLAEKDVARWRQAHQGAIEALDNHIPGFMDAVSSATTAERTLIEAGQAHKAAIDDAQKAAAAEAMATDKARADTLKGQNAADRDNTAGQLAARRDADRSIDVADRDATGQIVKERRDAAAAQDAQSKADMKGSIGEARGIAKAARATPAGQFVKAAGGAVATTEVENAVGAMLATGRSGAAKMRGLVQSVSHDENALAGLRKAAVDSMLRRFTNSDGSMAGATMIRFLTENRDTLAELFPHEQRVMFGALARDAENGKAWADQTKIKAGSDTAQNLHAMIGKAKDAAHHGSLMFVALDAIKDLVTEGHVSLPLMGSAATAYLANGLRSAGIKKRTDLVRAAMLDPQLARVLISKAPTATNMKPAHVLVGALRRSLILGHVTGAQPGQKPAPTSTPQPATPAQPSRRLLSDFMGR